MQLENQIKDLKALNDESEYQLEKSKDRVFKLERYLSDTLAKLNSQPVVAAATANNSSGTTSANNCRVDVVINNSTMSNTAKLTEEQVFIYTSFLYSFPF